MSLKKWLNNGWLNPHKTSKQEIRNPLDIVERDLTDSNRQLSADWKFNIAYNAALKLCTILLYLEGYKPAKNLQHYRTIQALPLILGKEYKNDANYLDTCRSKRNTAAYDFIGSVTENDAEELIEFTLKFRKDVISWIKKHYPDLIT